MPFSSFIQDEQLEFNTLSTIAKTDNEDRKRSLRHERFNSLSRSAGIEKQGEVIPETAREALLFTICAGRFSLGWPARLTSSLIGVKMQRKLILYSYEIRYPRRSITILWLLGSIYIVRINYSRLQESRRQITILAIVHARTSYEQVWKTILVVRAGLENQSSTVHESPSHAGRTRTNERIPFFVKLVRQKTTPGSTMMPFVPVEPRIQYLLVVYSILNCAYDW